MSLLSLFMTSTGIFCFVPISQRLIESGIIPASNRWRFRGLSSVLAPTFYSQNEEKTCQLAVDEVGDEIKDCYPMRYPLPHVPRYSVADPFIVDQQPVVSCANSTWSMGVVSPLGCSPLQSTSFDTFYGHESASFIRDSTLCESCNSLLRREIPPDPLYVPWRCSRHRIDFRTLISTSTTWLV